MTERDPFPMRSPEAQRLAASVGGNKSGGWNSMGTKSSDAGANESFDSVASATEGLMGSNKNIDEDDIYYGADAEPSEDEDEFLDRPMWESRGSPAKRTAIRALRGLEKLYKRLYGDQLPPEEMLRILCLATTLFYMIGGLWLLRSLKDAVLTALCGVTAIPKAKMLSVFVVLGVVSVYNYLLDSSIPRHRLFYIFGTFYFFFFVAVSFLLKHPSLGLENEQPSPYRILGWVSYCSVESFASVMVSLFWSFANSNISLESAKASYGIMVAMAQIGSILGPTIVNRYADVIGVANCYLLGAFSMLLLQATMYMYVSLYGTEERNPTPSYQKKNAGILEGLHLFRDHNYVKGIFTISCVFMMAGTIIDFTLKMLARDYFAEEYPCEIGMSCYDPETGESGMSQEATAAFAKFMGFFGQATNTLSFLLSLFGTSAVIRYLGLRFALYLFPSLILALVIAVRFHPTLYVVFGAMMLLKANSYALNNPTKEILYQVTSSSVKYKAKSWIDIFGARTSKAIGNVVANAFSHSLVELVSNGTLFGMCVASFLIWNARYMGAKFDEYTQLGYIVGQDPYGKAESEVNTEMAARQNEVDDTSCAIYGDKGGQEPAT